METILKKNFTIVSETSFLEIPNIQYLLLFLSSIFKYITIKSKFSCKKCSLQQYFWSI